MSRMDTWTVELSNGDTREVNAYTQAGAELQALSDHDEQYNNSEIDHSVKVIKSYVK